MSRGLQVQRIIREAGAIALNYFKEYKTLVPQQKSSPQDMVSIADQAVEEFIIKSLTEVFPGESFLAEESGLHQGDQTVWVIDPIDGTANFVRGIAYYCISIAMVRNGRVELGAVYDPSLDELFFAERGMGARLNSQPIHAEWTVPGEQITEDLAWSQALIALGHSYRYPSRQHWAAIPQLLDSGAGYRNLGSAALSLAHVAAGRFSAYYEPHLYPWDAFAGLLLAEESGAKTMEYMAENWQEGAAAFAAAVPIAARFEKLIKNHVNTGGLS